LECDKRSGTVVVNSGHLEAQDPRCCLCDELDVIAAHPIIKGAYNQVKEPQVFLAADFLEVDDVKAACLLVDFLQEATEEAISFLQERLLSFLRVLPPIAGELITHQFL
jgi:hypothetical protein